MIESPVYWIATFSLCWIFLILVPGALATHFLGPASAKPKDSPYALAALSIALGWGLYSVASLALRAAGASYLVVGWGWGAASALALAYAIRRPGLRTELGAVFKAVFAEPESLGAWLGFAAFAAWLTYGPDDLFHSDEHYRMAMVPALIRDFPMKDFLISGAPYGFRYYFGLEHWVAQAHVLTRIPIEMIYFRLLVPVHWFILWLGVRSLATTIAGAPLTWRGKLLVPVLVFAMIAGQPYADAQIDFSFRQNMFGAGLASCVLAAYPWVIRSNRLAHWALLGLAAAYVSLIKAPCGVLLAGLLAVDLLRKWRKREVRFIPPSVLGACLGLANLVYFSCFMKSPYVAKSIDGIGRLSWMAEEYFNRFFVPSRLGQWLSVDPTRHFTVLRGLLYVLWFSLVPLALHLSAGRGARADKRVDGGARAFEPISPWVPLAAGTGFFLFTTYVRCPSSTIYWLYFGTALFALPVFARSAALLDRRQVSWARVAIGLLVGLLGTASPSAVVEARKYTRWQGERWSPSHRELCRRLDEGAASDAVYLHNQLNHTAWRHGAYCRRAAYVTSYADALNQDPALYAAHKREALSFFQGKAADADAWLKERGVCFVLWDTGGAEGLPLAQYDLPLVASDGEVFLFKRKDCPFNISRSR